MTWLLTGGAGYIGSHVARALLGAGLGVVVLDDLSAGDPRRVPAGVPLVEASVLDTDRVRAALHEHNVTGVVHLAARKAVGESMERPLYYWRENVCGFESLLRAMADVGVEQLVFSSSAAVYGMPDVDLVTETTDCRPISPYGETKLVCEWMTRDACRASDLRAVSLRYFNVAGAGSPDLGDTSVNNLIPLALTAIEKGEAPGIFGDDYPTPDGTCIRDYIHVCDLADAHVVAAQRLAGGLPEGTFNIGRGRGSSVREVLDVVREVTDSDLDPVVVDRRPGDPPLLVASAAAAAEELGWRASRDLRDMVASAWEARRA